MSRGTGSTLQGIYTAHDCKTCQRRRVKCDNVKPRCLTCRAVGVTCEGFQSPTLLWRNPDATSDLLDPVSTRERPYTVEAQISMAAELNASLSNKPLDESLCDLEVKSRQIRGRDGEVIVGPFRAFSFQKSSSSAHNQPATAAADVSSELPASPPSSHDSRIDNRMTVGGELGDDDAHLPFEDSSAWAPPGNLLDWSDLFDLESAMSFMSPEGGFEEVPEIPFAAEPWFDTTQSGRDVPPESSMDVDMSSEQHTPRHNTESSEDQFLTNISTEDAQLLMTHYKESVIGHIWSLPLGKKSSMNLHVDAAALTLARQSFLKSHVSSASLSHLYAVLAISARHLSKDKTSHELERWLTLSDRLWVQAKRTWHYSLQHEISPKAAKYKDLVLAVSSHLSYAVLYDQQVAARAYMIDSERLLRTLGLAKRYISRKTSYMHHTYTWARIVGESTYVLRNYESIGRTVPTSPQPERRSSGNWPAYHENDQTFEPRQRQTHSNPRLDDFLGLESNAPEIGTTQPLEHESPLNNIHLETCGETSSDSTLRFLYGVSETWLSLVSQTTRLANLMDKYATPGSRGTIVPPQIEKRKQELEQLLWSYQMKASAQAGAIANKTDMTPRDFLVRALDAALTIFFYRRVRDVDPNVLRPHVDSVIEALRDFGAACERDGIERAGTPWPAFIAGCEALDPSQREFILTWLRNLYETTGFTRVNSAIECMEEVWRRQAENKKENCTWFSISKEKGWYIVLC